MDFRELAEKLTQYPYNFTLVETKTKNRVNDLIYLEKGNLKIYNDTLSIFKKDKFEKRYDGDLEKLLFLANDWV